MSRCAPDAISEFRVGINERRSFGIQGETRRKRGAWHPEFTRANAMRTMSHCLRATLLLLAAPVAAIGAQQPFSHFSESIEARYARTDLIVSYVLRVDSADLTGFDVV